MAWLVSFGDQIGSDVQLGRLIDSRFLHTQNMYSYTHDCTLHPSQATHFQEVIANEKHTCRHRRHKAGQRTTQGQVQQRPCTEGGQQARKLWWQACACADMIAYSLLECVCVWGGGLLCQRHDGVGARLRSREKVKLG